MQLESLMGEPELRLLCLCAVVRAEDGDQTAIRRAVGDGVDWTAFARKAAVHDLAGAAGHSLARAAPDLVPADILDALSLNANQIRGRNRALRGELVQAVEALAGAGIETIAFKAPVSDIRGYCELGLRLSGTPALLLGKSDVGRALRVLGNRGYARRRQLSAAQLDLIARLQGHEVLVRPAAEVGIGLYTRVAPMRAAFDIDHAGLWRRARRTQLQGRCITTLAPEDELLLMAAQYGEAPSWRLGWASEIAGFIGVHNELDWDALIERARAQGVLPMMLVATELARAWFGAGIPEKLAMAQRDMPRVERVTRRVVADWRADNPVAPSGWRGWLEALPRGRGGRRARYLAAAFFLPDARHIARMKVPDRLTGLPAYVALKIAHDLALLPLVRGWRGFRAAAGRARDRLAGHEATLALLPLTGSQRRLWRRRHAGHAAARRAAAADPNDLSAWSNLGDALFELKRYQEAIACYEKVLASAPGNRSVWRKCARARAARGGVAGWSETDAQPVIDPADADAWAQRAGFLVAAERFSEAAAASDRALAIDPGHLAARRIAIGARINCCDWRQRDADKRWVSQSLNAGRHALTPFTHRAISDSAAENLLSARLWAKAIPRPATPLWNGEAYRHDRIRLAYLSGEFRDHPTAILIAGVLEQHDRTRFEVTAVSLGAKSAAPLGRRIEAACERMIEVADFNDAEAAAAMRAIEIDIAVDLNGHAGAGRPSILAHRPAPLQVNYLGNAGTTGAPFLDYIIADRTVLPSAHFHHYTEQVVHLPHSYQCNDSRRNRPQATLSRYDAGLPETGFVYCCFNNLYKLSPEIFDVWMRLLHASPGAVLWLLGEDRFAIHNLRREAGARGIAPERLIFAPRAPVDEHLARQTLADLFLDTLPMNAHATASDALWAGLPLLTCLGNSFGGRVAGSLLRAVGLPELVAESLAEYEELAMTLARDPGRLTGLRERLARNRDTEPLFDTPRYTRDLESAYLAMWRRHRAGLPPSHIDIGREAMADMPAASSMIEGH
jgi:predicted O-linked N-acetylglucosamine transferase (SPINDLY family)